MEISIILSGKKRCNHLTKLGWSIPKLTTAPYAILAKILKKNTLWNLTWILKKLTPKSHKSKAFLQKRNIPDIKVHCKVRAIKNTRTENLINQV